ncbi:UNVERIFIED_CONTAM: hypothetical protein K2H54_060279 [Gekko kuhli]
MAGARGARRAAAEDELPVYLARPGTTAQTPRQKYGGMFASVEGAYENKTIDFEAYSVGQKGARTPRSASRHDLLLLDGAPARDPCSYSGSASDASEVSGSLLGSPGGERDDSAPPRRPHPRGPPRQGAPLAPRPRRQRQGAVRAHGQKQDLDVGVV